jgi:hypothetical protein
MKSLALLLCASTGLWASWTNTSPGIDLDKLPHAALTKVRAGVLAVGEKAAFEGITAAASADEVVLTGKSKSGQAWTVHLCGSCFDEVWRADLDANGTQDYVIFGAGPYDEGRTNPLFSLSFLLMDSDGLPLPYFAGVFHGENGDGVKHLVSWDSQIRLLVSRYDEIPSDGSVAPYCSGHWVSQVYEFANGAVREVRKTLGGIRFPYVKNWAYSGPECENHPVGFTGPANIRDYGTTAKDIVKQLEECEEVKPEAAVSDTAARREIAFLNLRGDAQSQLMKSMPAPEMRGAHGCAVSLLWARPASQ